MTSTATSPEAQATAPIADPKDLRQFETMLEQQKANISAEDFAKIKSRTDWQKSEIARFSYDEIIVARISDTYLTEQKAALESAIRNQKIVQAKQATAEIKAPAIQAAAQGNPEAKKALDSVDAKVATLADRKTEAGKAIKAETPPQTKALAEKVLRTDAVLRDLRAQFDEKINFNDALAIILENPEAFNGKTAFSYETLEKLLTSKGYVTRRRSGKEDWYLEDEMDGVVALANAVRDPKVAKVLRGKVDIQRTIIIDEKSTEPKQMLARLLDFSGDGRLTSYNGKEYSKNAIFAGLQKLFGGGKDAQLRSATELATYQKLSAQVNSPADIATLIANKTGRNESEVLFMLDKPNEFKKLVAEFQRAFMAEVAQSTPETASKVDAKKDIQNYQVEKAAEQARQIGKITEQLKKEGMAAKVQDKLVSAGYPKLDAKTMDELTQRTAFRVYSLNPQYFMSVGANVSVNDKTINTTTNTTLNTTTNTTTNLTTNTTTNLTTNTEHITNTTNVETIRNIIKHIDIVQDSTGKEISRKETAIEGTPNKITSTSSSSSTTSKTESSTASALTSKTEAAKTSETKSTNTSEHERKVKINPTIVIGFNQNIFGAETESFNARVGAGAAAVAGVNGIIFPITVSASANATVDNANAQVQTRDLKGNFVLGGRLSLSLDAASGKTAPSFGFDINPNDVGNAIEKQNIRLENLFSKIGIKENGDVDLAAINVELERLEKSAGKNEELLSELSLMRRFLRDMETVVNANKLDPATKRIVMLNSINGFKSAYSEAIHTDLRGFHLSGANISFVPGINAVFFGINFQHVTQVAKKKDGVDSTEAKMSERELTADNAIVKKYLTFGKDTINVKASDIEEGNVAIDPKISQTDAENGEKSLKATGENRLRYRYTSHRTGEGILIHMLIIDQVPAKVTVKEAEAVKPVSEGQQKLVEIYQGKLLTAADRKHLFEISRSNPQFINALNAILAGDFDKAEKTLRASKHLHFLVAKMPTATLERNMYLDNLLLATSGSRGLREKANVTVTELKHERKHNEASFKRRLGIDAKNQEMNAEYQRIQDELVIGRSPRDKVQLAPLSSVLGEGYRDIAGTITYSQVNGKGKSTVRGLGYFNGDLQVYQGLAEVQNASLKLMVLDKVTKSGAFDKNLTATNAILGKNGVRPFTSAEYNAYLLNGTLSEDHAKVLEPKAAKFFSTWAALPGATCYNDIFAVAFPLVNIKGKPGEPSRIVDSAPIGYQHSTGDVYDSRGEVNNGTIGLSLTRMTENVVQNVVQNKTEELVKNVTVNDSKNVVVNQTANKTETTQVVNPKETVNITTETTITKLPPGTTGGTTEPGGVENPGEVVVIPGAGGIGI